MIYGVDVYRLGREKIKSESEKRKVQPISGISYVKNNRSQEERRSDRKDVMTFHNMMQDLSDGLF